MTSKNRWLAIQMAEVGIRALETPMSQTEDPMDASCAHCGIRGALRPVLDIIQWGMFENRVITIFICNECGCHSYVKYASTDDANLEF